MRILLGVSGGIAAYKACEIVRSFQKRGFEVSVIMTQNATRFIGIETFRALTGDDVHSSLFDADDPIPHIHLAEAADAFVIAPATANVCAKLASGIADDLLSATALASTCPLFVAPAMNVHMFEHPATQQNLKTLEERGAHIIAPDSGYLACGEVGVGKLPEPEDIVCAVSEHLSSHPRSSEGILAGRKVLITSGPTVEPIDPVRFVSNRSSGKMGSALAKAAVQAGAQVSVVSGPVGVPYDAKAQVVFVQTAKEMLSAVLQKSEEADILICAAAVSDMRPDEAALQKLKKGHDDERLACIRMVPNPDILYEVGCRKHAGQVIVGFAAETEDAVEHGREKLARKGADIMVVNDVVAHDVFGSDTNTVFIITEDEERALGELPKTEVAKQVLGKAASMLLDEVCARP